jgi:hypothetical protein
MTIAPGDPDWRPPSSTTPRNGCLTAFLILVGVILLLPGVCGIILLGTDWKELSTDQTALLITVGLLALGACGIGLIWRAIRRG